ncbi:hypothetical protein ACQJBY_064868 [Aegilops geniculata]
MSSCQMLMGSLRCAPAISTMDVATRTRIAVQSLPCVGLDRLRLLPASIPSAEPVPLREDPPSSKGHSRTGQRRKGVTTTQSRLLRGTEHRRCRQILYQVVTPHRREAIALLVVAPGHCVCVGSL